MERKTYNSQALNVEAELDWLVEPFPHQPSRAALATISVVISAAICAVGGYVFADRPFSGFMAWPFLVVGTEVVLERCFGIEAAPANPQPGLRRRAPHSKIGHLRTH